MKSEKIVLRILKLLHTVHSGICDFNRACGGCTAGAYPISKQWKAV